MRELRREIEIDAPPERVWAVVTDFAAYPEWNPFIRRVSGELREGARLEVRIEPPGARATTFKPTVRAVEANRELRWLGRLLVPGIIDGEHSLLIEPREGGRSRVVMSERFTGVLVGFVKGTVAKTEVGFEQMNTALKRTSSSPPLRADIAFSAALVASPDTFWACRGGAGTGRGESREQLREQGCADESRNLKPKLRRTPKWSPSPATAWST